MTQGEPPSVSKIQYCAPSAHAGQVIVVGAVALSVLLAFTALVLNAGFFLVERRGLQNAADAAGLAAVWKLAEEHSSRSFRDTSVFQAADTLARQNGVDVGGTRQLDVVYVDSSGADLGPAGGGGQFLATAAGVRVALYGPFATLLSPFLAGGGIQARAEAEARLTRTAYPAIGTNPVPLALPLAAFDAGASVDLYDQSVPAAAYGVAGFRPFLDLAHASNSGAGYTPGQDFGDINTNVQFWSDGAHNSGALSIGTRVALAGGATGADVELGLKDNVRRQGLTDASGASYTLVVVPLWDTYIPAAVAGDPDRIEVVGFATVKILASDIQVASLGGFFVPYVIHPPSPNRVSGPLWGPSAVVLTR